MKKVFSFNNTKIFSFISEGCIHHSGLLKTWCGDFFLKWNDALKFPGMFEAEAKGLGLLSAPSVILTPQVIGQGSAGNDQFILLEFIEPGTHADDYWTHLGSQLGLLPAEKPSLLHGDLWRGNLITTKDGRPCIIDPAVYYGHREAELAYTSLLVDLIRHFIILVRNVIHYSLGSQGV